MLLHWRYLLDIRSLTVVVLFFMHAFTVYECAMKGHQENRGGSRRTGNPLMEKDDDVVIVGPMYSIRVYFLRHWPKGGETRDCEAVARDVAPADVLILAFPEGMSLNQTEVVKHFGLLQRWSWITPWSPSPDIGFTNTHSLPERRLSSAEKERSPVPVIFRLREISEFLDVKWTSPMVYSRSDGDSIAACFLLEKEPSHIPIPSDGTSQEEIMADKNTSRFLARVADWSRAHNASFSLFISPCRMNRVHVWEKRHFHFMGNITVWWLCAASDTFIELNVAAKLVTAISEM
ncbi:hypothetical protein MOQ_004864 [Trypanosoma cruzi marinkellei]|uniref:Uncharacterized protein n=1 Tax=Trypanosoma cruzi marinkellei TaxID=85056 RepID=K2M8C9_TRYCR|nr:hypothetical protein MOQ_004864 [Trypanosoma cruzi marinkellei]